MKTLSRESLLKKKELKRVEVILNEETGEGVWVRQMTAREKNNWEISQHKKVVTKGTRTGRQVTYDLQLEDYRAKLAVQCVCDAKGELLFKPEDVEMLSINMSAADLEKIVDVANDLNTITKEEEEDMVKN